MLHPVEITGLFIFLVGLYGMIAHRNGIKIILSLGVSEIGIILFILGIHYQAFARPPIGPGEGPMADPLPQAMMITAIIIGAAVTAVSLMMFIALYHRYGSTNWDKVRALRNREEEENA